jgi:hypothetical protein
MRAAPAPRPGIKERLAAAKPRPTAAAPQPAPPPPPAPEPSRTRPASAPSITEALSWAADDVDIEIDDGLAAIERKTNRAPPMPGSVTVDLTEVKQLFAKMAANHMRQVSDFMIELRWGTTTVEWAELCQPAVQSLQRAAETLEFTELHDALGAFSAALRATSSSGAHTVQKREREIIEARHADLVRIMPDAFAFEAAGRTREAMIVQSLLEQVPEAKKVTIDKLYAAGLSTLAVLFLSTPDEIVATTGIDSDVATRIVKRFRDYKREILAAAPDGSSERSRLDELATSLAQQTAEYERAFVEGTQAARQRKKVIRLARAQAALEAQVLLARLGATDVVHDFERASYAQKVVTLRGYLDAFQNNRVTS